MQNTHDLFKKGPEPQYVRSSQRFVLDVQAAINGHRVILQDAKVKGYRLVLIATEVGAASSTDAHSVPCYRIAKEEWDANTKKWGEPSPEGELYENPHELVNAWSGWKVTDPDIEYHILGHTPQALDCMREILYSWVLIGARTGSKRAATELRKRFRHLQKLCDLAVKETLVEIQHGGNPPAKKPKKPPTPHTITPDGILAPPPRLIDMDADIDGEDDATN